MTTARANERLAALLESEDEGQALVFGTQRRIGDLQKALGNNPSGEGAGQVRKDLIRLQERLTEHQTRHQQRASLNASIRGWLERLPASAIVEDVRLPKVKLKPGETHGDAVDRIRAELATIIGERFSVLQCGLPKSELYAQAKKWVIESAIRGSPTIRAGHDTFQVSFNSETIGKPNPRPEDILCWAMPDVMTARLQKEVDMLPVPKLALTPSEREKRLADFKIRILDLERSEEEHILAAEADGQFIARRPAAAPEALLGVVIKRKDSVAA